jgi:predicted LPLAT superfamily acyltransferase
MSRVVLYGIAAYFLIFAPAARRVSRSYLQRPQIEGAGADELACSISGIFISVIHDRVFLIASCSIFAHNQALIDELVDEGQGLFPDLSHSVSVLRAIIRYHSIAMAMYE